MEKILLYGLNEERQSQISILLKAAGFNDITFLTEEDSKYLVGYLHGLPGYEKEPHALKEPVLEVEFMMIGGFDKEGINNLFAAFRAMGAARPVTSALTEVNRNWVLGDVINEVYDEHLIMTGQKPAPEGF